MLKELICINCPQGCHLNVNYTPETGECGVGGNRCPRGEAYAKQEMTDPRRMVTAVVRTGSRILPFLPVRTSRVFPKPLIPQLLNQLYAMTVQPPLEMGQAIWTNALGTGIDVIATEPCNE